MEEENGVQIMPVDFDESRMLGELNDLEDERHLIMHNIDTCIPARVAIYNRILDKLDREKERLEMRLKIHRQKVKESGIKY